MGVRLASEPGNTSDGASGEIVRSSTPAESPSIGIELGGAKHGILKAACARIARRIREEVPQVPAALDSDTGGLGTSKRRQVAAAPQINAQVAGQRPHVGAGGAVDDDVQVDHVQTVETVRVSAGVGSYRQSVAEADLARNIDRELISYRSLARYYVATGKEDDAKAALAAEASLKDAITASMKGTTNPARLDQITRLEREFRAFTKIFAEIVRIKDDSAQIAQNNAQSLGQKCGLAESCF